MIMGRRVLSKSEIRISRLETNRKSKFRNRFFGVTFILKMRACFEFRASGFDIVFKGVNHWISSSHGLVC
jgi:hypothetical protein